MPVGSQAAVVGIVPDGVSAVRLHFENKTQHFAVRDNLFTGTIDLPIDRAFPRRLTWTNDNGIAINTITPDVVRSDFARP